MMLSRTGWGETSLPVAFQTVGGRRAPWGCAAGAPYRGTASPPPPWSPHALCVCVCVCVCAQCSVFFHLSVSSFCSLLCVPYLRYLFLHPPQYAVIHWSTP